MCMVRYGIFNFNFYAFRCTSGRRNLTSPNVTMFLDVCLSILASQACGCLVKVCPLAVDVLKALHETF